MARQRASPRPLRPQDKVSLPVASSAAPSRVLDELLFNLECPARVPRAGRRHRQNRQRPLTLMKLVRSRSNVKDTSARNDDVLRGGGQGRAVTSCAGSALPLEEKTSLLA